MADYKAPVADMQFLLKSVFEVENDWKRSKDFRSYDLDLATTVLSEASRIAEQTMAPLARAGDELGASWHDGEVRAPEGFKEAFGELTAGGWLGITGNTDFGGQGMPKILATAVEEMFWGANTNLWLYAGLTTGACYCIDQHADPDIRQTYLPPMYEGKWTGAMALTESHAGTDLGMLRTQATSQADGSYRLKGTKIFITSGEHDLADNIIHLVLARMPDAPEGSRGISLFLVPKFIVDANGEPGERNGFSSASIEKKMGIHGSATSVIVYEDAVGYLIGEPNQGLASMFTMMNFARLSVGVQGLGLAQRAYTMSSNYAVERVQGKSLSSPPTEAEADPIISHPDVRRMLLTQRAYVEGSRAFSMFVAQQLDLAYAADDDEVRSRALALVELLTPVAKAFLTDRAMECTLLAQQCYGGHGYIQEIGIEQVVRDTRITQIYEGTNGVQAMDLVARKVVRNGGQIVRSFADAISDSLPPGPYEQQLRAAIDRWLDVTAWICEQAPKSPALLNGIAVEYLDLTGHVLFGWMWARMVAADEDGRLGKRLTADFYFAKLLPKISALDETIRAGVDVLLAPAAGSFG